MLVEIKVILLECYVANTITYHTQSDTHMLSMWFSPSLAGLYMSPVVRLKKTVSLELYSSIPVNLYTSLV